jgi:ankyrin repeat domain-containing protein 17
LKYALLFYDILFQASDGSLQPVVDLDSETDSNHDTALTLACAGGHEELVTLLLDRGADIGE